MTSTARQPAIARTLAALFALTGWTILALQLWLALTNADGSISTAKLLLNYFSFFTILGNLLITIIFTRIALFPPGPTASLQAAAASYIAVVGIGYSLLLRALWNPVGLQKLADGMLHDVMPLVYVIFWILFGRPLRRLPWRSALLWLIAPLLYLLYSLLRGTAIGWYPYHFLDPRIAGWPHVFSIIGGFLIAFLALGLAAVALTRRQPPAGLPRDTPRISPNGRKSHAKPL